MIPKPEPVVSGIPIPSSHTVTVTDINGRVSTDTVQVNAIGELVVDFPPHSHPMAMATMTLCPGADDGDLEYFAIYNRWVSWYFGSNTATLGWDGMFNGKEAELGSYVVWYARARTSWMNKGRTGYFTLRDKTKFIKKPLCSQPDSFFYFLLIEVSLFR